MLFSYPVEVAAENWLHESVIAAVENIHSLVESRKRMLTWPNILPEAHRKKLESRSGLKDRLNSYAKALRKLSVVERQQVLAALVAQNKISELLSRQCDCEDVGHLPEVIRKPILSLFSFVFGLLTAYEVRQRQYIALCAKIPARVCPFCGCERLDAPGAPQEDLDHYIPRSKYPFAAANLRNLAPMGGRCNSAYKHMQDPLRKENGARRSACDPYSTTAVKVSLDNSVVNEANAGPIINEWMIEFTPTNEAVETWDELFHIRERWKRDVLDETTFNQWLGDFRNYCRTANLQILNDNDIQEALERYELYVAGSGIRDLAFLKSAIFRFLMRRCTLDCQRVVPILRDLVGVSQPA